MLLKVQDRSDLARDTRSQALLNIDNEGLTAYRTRREKNRTMDSVIEEVSNMKQDINEIKQLLSRFLESK
jgi:hypothetical protein